MTHPWPGPIIPVDAIDPCAASPTITSVGSPTVASPNTSCTTGPQISVSVTLSASLPATGYDVQVRGYWGNSSGNLTVADTGWTTVSGWSGSSGTATAIFSTVDENQGVLGDDRFYRLDIRVRRGTTVCDEETGTEGSSSGWEACV